jgi:hypothetical protein
MLLHFTRAIPEKAELPFFYLFMFSADMERFIVIESVKTTGSDWRVSSLQK